jgi:hypothetical protein
MTAYEKYFKHLENQNGTDFMKTIDLGYKIKEIKKQIKNIQTNINIIDEKLNYEKKQFKTDDVKSKNELVLKMKELGNQKKSLLEQIDKLLDLLNKQNDGLRVKLSRMSPDKEFEFQVKGKKVFVDFISDIAVDIPEIKEKFIQKMVEYYNKVYLSDYAKKISREKYLEKNSRDIFRKIVLLPSFQRKNSLSIQKAFNIDLINSEIYSYL